MLKILVLAKSKGLVSAPLIIPKNHSQGTRWLQLVDILSM